MRNLERLLKWKFYFIGAFLVLLFFLLRGQFKNSRSYDHFFIFRSFYYSLARGFGDGDSSAIVLLVNIDKSIDPENLNPVCEVELLDGSWTQTRAIIRPIHDAETSEGCRLRSYRFLCHSLERTKYRVENGETIKTPDFKLKIGNAESVEMPLVRADEKKRTLVICPGRMFAFDMWHLFLLAMELNRLHQVDLVVIYIQSIDPRVYELVKEYAMEDWVEIRYSLHMPERVESLDYNPNAETTWNNQLVNFHDCLYEFRESAEFIAFPDWDDLMLAGGADIDFGKSIRPLGPIFVELARREPKVASFAYIRSEGYYKKLEELYDERVDANIDDIVKNTIKSLSFPRIHSPGSGKVVLRPLYADGVQIHLVANLRDGYKEQKISWDHSLIVHARNHGKFKMSDTLKNVTQFEKKLKRILEKPNIRKKLSKLPTSEKMQNNFNLCLGDESNAWINIFNKVEASKDYRCYNYAQCNLNMPKMDCINVKTSWTEVKAESENIYFSYFSKAKFELGKTCTI